jgi:hydrogenase-4 component B
MGLFYAYLGILGAALLLLPFLRVEAKGGIAIGASCALAMIGGYFAVLALSGHETSLILAGTQVTGPIPIRIDALSGWFILLINFTILTGGFYGLQYMKAYRDQKANLSLHCMAFLLVQSMLSLLCAVQNSLVFLFAWEIMALSAFMLVIFEHLKSDTIRAGINYLIQSHVSIVALMAGFIWVAYRMGSYDFQAIRDFSASFSHLNSLALFLVFFAGFGLKAGFVPFHTWLPYAHPAAPSHVSGIMSGVLIKIGIYGILRMILLVETDYLVLGFLLLFMGVISGLCGVMLAILQHNLKKLLAYHSIENIGIIGIGIGLGVIGLGLNNAALSTLGFAGAMLHVLNHSLFKSLLFFSAGNVYQATHSMNIEHFGGLIKKMPHTAGLFLVASLAICGLPPFNGFVSEFLIYSGLYLGLGNDSPVMLFGFVASLFGLVLIGGLAIFCFTKAFGAVFLGTPRREFAHVSEVGRGKLIPMYAVVVAMMSIGLFPGFYLELLSAPLAAFEAKMPGVQQAAGIPANIAGLMTDIGLCAAGLIALVGAVFFVRQRAGRRQPVMVGPTWGCGYVGDASRMQYTASSFVRTYRKLFEPLFSIHKKKKPVEGIFPEGGGHETHPYDKTELWLIDKPLKILKDFIGKFQFLQNGNPQFYIFYGVVFIALVILVPMLAEGLSFLLDFLNQL